MAIATTPTKLPLATWAKILGMHPLHFEGVAFTPKNRGAALCDQALFQHSWQEPDRTGREEIAQAIADAENMLELQLGWRLIPTWESDEWVRIARPGQPELNITNARDLRGYASVVKASWSKILTGGREAKTLMGAAQAITWSDEDSDGYDETGTVTINAGVAVACEIEVYYPGHDGDPAYQIRPAKVVVASGAATITFRRELCVVEDILNALTAEPADPIADDDFLTEVDVYRHWNDPADQVQLLWSPRGCNVCLGNGCSLCAYTAQSGCLHLRSTPDGAILGWSPGEYDPDTDTFQPRPLKGPGAPDLARLYYQAGHVAKTGCPMDMDRAWARTVTYLSLSLLDRPGCDCTANVWAFWRQDMGISSGGDQDAVFGGATRQYSAGNPFGTRRGAVYAWDRVRDPGVHAVRTGVLI